MLAHAPERLQPLPSTNPKLTVFCERSYHHRQGLAADILEMSVTEAATNS